MRLKITLGESSSKIMQDYTVSSFNKTVLILVYKGFFLTLPLISQFHFVVDNCLFFDQN